MYDILIRGGDLVDGTGSARRRADVGIQGDRVVAIGDLDEGAAETIDATGKVVAPGFVDVHTHYDAQVFWDGALTPSPLHGSPPRWRATAGSPSRPLSDDAADGDYLMRMLARVEGMPLESLREGVPWNWKTTAEYFDEIEGRLGINAGFMVGHSAIRARGDGRGGHRARGEARGARGDAGPAARRARRRRDRLLVVVGAHAQRRRGAHGAVALRVARRDRRPLQRRSRSTRARRSSSSRWSARFEPWAVELMASMSAAAQRPLNWNVLGVNAKNFDDAEQKLEAGDYAREHGGRVVALTVPMSFPVYLSFRSGFILDAMPGWEDVMGLPLDEKLEFFDDDDTLAKLDEQSQRDKNPMRMLANWGNLKIHDVVAPENEQYRGRMVGEIAEDEGRSAVGRAHVDRPGRRAEHQLRHRPRAGDRRRLEGAHPGVARPPGADRRIRRRRAPRPAGVVQLRDRGARQGRPASGSCSRSRRRSTSSPTRPRSSTASGSAVGVEEGWKADVVVLDPETIGSHDVRMRMDLPGGAGRLYAEADGIEHVLVNGTAIVRDGEAHRRPRRHAPALRPRHRDRVTRLKPRAVAGQGVSASVSVVVASTRRPPAARTSWPRSGRAKPVSESTSVT